MTDTRLVSEQKPMLAGTVAWGDVALAAATAATGYYMYKSQQDTNAQNVQLGRDQMAFQSDMSNTSYQRAVADMQAAGINPMLSAKLGGASTPGGAMPQVQNEFAPVVSSAGQMIGMISEAQKIDQNVAATEQIKAATKKIESETLNRDVATAKQSWELDKLKGDTRSAWYDAYTKQGRFDAMNEVDEKGRLGGGFRAETDKIKFDAMKSKYGLDAAKAESDFYKSDLGMQSPYAKYILQLLKGVTSAVGAVR